MTMFTANGLLYAQARGMNRGILGPLEDYVFAAYQEWLLTQEDGEPAKPRRQTTRLLNIAQMHSAFSQTGAMCRQEIDLLGARVTALIHGHPLGYIPATALTHIISEIVYENCSIEAAVADSIDAIYKLFPGEYSAYLADLITEAGALAASDTDDLEAIERICGGWVAEKTPAIVVYCSMKYHNNFAGAVTAAVSHNGDSDSTGART